MVQSESLHYPSSIDLARQGNARAIANWLNQILIPYGIHTYAGFTRSGLLKLLIEFQFLETPESSPADWQEPLIRLICHRLWKLNSPVILGVNIAAQFASEPEQRLWKQSVRIVTPANRQVRQQPQRRSRRRNSSRRTADRTASSQSTSRRNSSQPIPIQSRSSQTFQPQPISPAQESSQAQQIRSRIRQTARRKHQLRLTRTLLVGGPAVAAIVVGGIIGYTKAPTSQTDATAASQFNTNAKLPNRPDTVRTALENVSVIKHNKVSDPQDPTVTLMFAGDVTMADHFEEVIGKDYKRPFAALDDYRKADLSMVNLENPLTHATSQMPDKQFNFKADPASAQVLSEGGVDIVNLANNHTMDFQADGLKETMDTLSRSGIEYVGAGKDLTEARRPKIIDVKGQRVAYLSYWGDEYGAEANKPGVNSIKEDRIAEDIRAIRDQVDWVVVNYHWGEELAETPADWQVKLGHFTIDQGADVVVGHHPHVLQGAEIYKGRPIAYSMGNFIFGGNPRTDYDTAVMKVALKDKQMKVEFLPIEVKDYQPKVVQGDRGKQILQHLGQLSGGFQQPMQSPVVLDARNSPAPTPDATAAPAAAPTDTTSPPDATNSAPAPSSLPSPDAMNSSPTPGVPTPDAVQPSPDATSSPNAIDPADVLPGYGGVTSPATNRPADASPNLTSPNPTSPDPISPNSTLPAPSSLDTPTLPAPAQPDVTAPMRPQTSPSAGDSAQPQPPTNSNPGTPVTSAPDKTPDKASVKARSGNARDDQDDDTGFDTTMAPAPQLPPIAKLQFSRPSASATGKTQDTAFLAPGKSHPPAGIARSANASLSSISFRVGATPLDSTPDSTSSASSASASSASGDIEQHDVALAGPMMW